MINTRKHRRWLACTALIPGLLAWCCTFPPATPVDDPAPGPTAALSPDGSLDAENATLGSLEKIDDYPLYTMHFVGPYDQYRPSRSSTGPAWACSLFAALGDPDSMVYGRNFDWEYSPALLLYTDPPDGYASLSMVDIAYLVEPDKALSLTDLPLAEREPLLAAPHLPFDGMNDQGLVVGMAAVPASEMPHDPGKETAGSLTVIREMLDHARDVDEAVAILERYNIDWDGGPPLHYMIADASGRAVLVEFHDGRMVRLPNEGPYHQATNHLRATASGDGGCRRYGILEKRLAEAGGRLAPQEAIDLLEDVAQDNTQWSIVYEISTGKVLVAMGRAYDEVHAMDLPRSP